MSWMSCERQTNKYWRVRNSYVFMNKHRGVEAAVKKNRKLMSSEGRAEADEGTHWSNHKENKKQIRARISFYICNMFQCRCAYKDGFSISSGVIKTFSCGSFSCACVHDQNSQRRPNAGRKRELRKELQVMLRAFRWVHLLRHLIFPLLSHSRGARLFIKFRTKLFRNRIMFQQKRILEQTKVFLWN